MNNHLRDIAKKRFNADLDALPEREQRVVQHFGDRQHVSHDTNLEFEKKLTFGQRLADKVAMFGGSWTFIIIFAAILFSWVLLNAFLLARRGNTFDPYPYILLNLFLSMLAAIQAPIILMSQNRQSVKDRLDAAHSEVTRQEVRTFDGHILAYNLLMLLPPFAGVGPVIDTGITDSKNFIRVDHSMRVKDGERMYAVGDSTNLRGAKTAHMSVRQAEVAAANVQAEIEGRTPSAKYEHEIRSIIDEGGRDSIYLHKKVWTDEAEDVSQGRVWHWAKMVQEKTWMLTHS